MQGSTGYRNDLHRSFIQGSSKRRPSHFVPSLSLCSECLFDRLLQTHKLQRTLQVRMSWHRALSCCCKLGDRATRVPKMVIFLSSLFVLCLSCLLHVYFTDPHLGDQSLSFRQFFTFQMLSALVLGIPREHSSVGDTVEICWRGIGCLNEEFPLLCSQGLTCGRTDRRELGVGYWIHSWIE